MRHTLVLLAASLTVAAAAAGDYWPQFRGPHGDGVSDATGLPLTWGEKENVVWKTPIHDRGWSSPVVWGDQVWMTTATADGKQMFAVCVDRKSGQIVHDLKLFENDKPEPLGNPMNTYASPTPAVEEGRVYVHFGSYGTACLDTKTGEKVWERRDLPCDHFRGPASSPILYDHLVFLQFDGVDQQYIAALDKASGRTVWKKDRTIDYGVPDGDRKKAFGTPSILNVKGKAELVSPAAVATTAYEPLTGEEIWRVYHGGMNAATPPIYGLGRVFLTTGDGGLKLLAVNPEGSGDLTKTNTEWTYNRNVPSHASPILVGDLLYMANESGVASCLDARAGTQVWQQRLGGQFWASPVYADGRLYFFDNAGTAVVAEPGREWKKLAANQLDDGCMASPAVAGKSLFVRTKTHLYRIEKKD